MRVVFSVAGTPLKFTFECKGIKVCAQEKKHYRLKIAKKLPHKYLALHSTLLVKAKKGILVSGASKSGKSTLSESIVRKFGYKICANDFVVVWTRNRKLFAADLNYEKVNQRAIPVEIKKIIFLAPDDSRDIFRFTVNEFLYFYKLSLEGYLPSIQTLLLKIILRKHVVFGNRRSVSRWLKLFRQLDKDKRIKKIGIVGVGTVGSEILGLLTLKTNFEIHTFSPNYNKLTSNILDAKSANPSARIFTYKRPSGVFKNSDAVIFSFKSMDTAKPRLEAQTDIVWQLSREIRKIKYGGLILVLSNPVDTLCDMTYLLSNMNDNLKTDWKGLFSNQVLGAGIGLDNKRLKVFGGKNLKIIGFHDESLYIAKEKSKSLFLVNNPNLLRKVSKYSETVRRYIPRTRIGPSCEVVCIVKALGRKKVTKTLIVSSMTQGGLYSGDFWDYKNWIPQKKFEISKDITNKFCIVMKKHGLLRRQLFKKLSKSNNA